MNDFLSMQTWMLCGAIKIYLLITDNIRAYLEREKIE